MILVTGGSGLLGTTLIEQLLSAGHTVKATWNKTPLPSFDGRLLREQCDILDVVALQEVMEGISKVFNCAGLVSFHPKDKQRLYKINVEGTANIVNAAVNAGVEKMVHVSSVSSLGRIREDGPINESMHWTPATSNSTYGHSKYLGEMEVWRGIAEGLNAVIVNPVIILGPGKPEESSTAIFRSVLEEFPWYTNGSTGFVDVRDVVKAMILLMDSDVTGERFIISAENRDYRDVFNMIAKDFNKKSPHKKVSSFMASLVWRLQAARYILTGSPPLVTRETARTAMTKASFDNSKLKNFFPGFQYYPLQQTITDTCRLLQQKLNNH
ncbi:MAG TPA: NAD-dependent epimerase/dehydratase family protein [Ferruginibacter sp.]|nr:NAD-dependent epimerase/dehydratase family protein [Ferruginibacter sp.]